ncbi:hypothetical protein QQ045_025433 [Rhodiola kirilowii]
MLAVLSPLGNLNGQSSSTQQQQSAEMEAFSIIGDEEFPDFSSGHLLESIIDFDDLFSDSDVLPDLEMDPNLLAEFSLSSGEDYYSDIHTTSVEKTAEDTSTGGQSFGGMDNSIGSSRLVSDTSGCVTSQGDQEMVSKRDPDPSSEANKEGLLSSPSSKKEANNRHSKAHKNNNKSLSGVSSKRSSKEGLQGKRKVKVDWTPELHRRFVQAVEQLGVDKAVPSRILEIMGIDCLTRHNIASHLQKYRSHRKHLLAREAEAASWSQRRHAYAGVTTGAAVLGKRERGSPWLVPTIGFPPITSPPQPLHGHGHHIRPLHVWGHPSVDHSTLRPVWPKHSPSHPSLQPHPVWPSPAHPMPRDSSPYWKNAQFAPQRIRNGLCQGAPCFLTPSLGATRFPVQPIQGFPPHAMYKVDQVGVPAGVQSRHHPLPDFHPSKESLDAAIGDVLTKPWLPLPIGLKPPELESVMGELQRNGVPNIPPASA